MSPMRRDHGHSRYSRVLTPCEHPDCRRIAEFCHTYPDRDRYAVFLCEAHSAGERTGVRRQL